MARSVRSPLETRSTRLRLPAGKEHWQTLQKGLAVGYYRPSGRGDGAWWGRVRINGSYIVKSLAAADDHADTGGLDWVQAQAAVRAWAAKQTTGGPLTTAEVVRTYLDDLRARKGAPAAANAEGRLKRHLLSGWGERIAVDLTAADFTAIRNAMVPSEADQEQLRRARDSANRTLSVAKAAFNLAFETGRLTDDRPWRKVKAFKDVGAARKVFLDPAEQQRLVDACEPGLRELVAVGAQTGARLGELTSARVRDFDPEAGTLHVRGKTGEREIYLAAQTILLLRRIAHGKRPDELLLPPADRPTWTRNLHSKRFAAAVKKTGLDPATTFYALRHSYISRALKRLVPIKALADHVGSSMAIIEKHYARFIVDDKRRYAEIAAPELHVDGAGAEVIPLREAVR